MILRFALLAGIALLTACAPAPQAAPGAAQAAAPEPPVAETASTPEPFVPDDFDPPRRVETEGFVIVPLGPEVVQIDYDAYMSSIEHLQQTFTRSTSWPTADLDADDAILDMENEQRRFEDRESFAYAVLTPDGSRERGCVYVRPSAKPGYDAVVRMWVTQAEYDAGFDAELQAWVLEWVDRAWPFETVAYPGRTIDWAIWDALPDAGAG